MERAEIASETALPLGFIGAMLALSLMLGLFAVGLDWFLKLFN